MKNFKPGQKVVFSTEHLQLDFDIRERGMAIKGALFPKEMEVVTIHEILKSNVPGYFVLQEYPYDFFNKPQAIGEIALFPLEEIGRAETEKILASIEKKRYRIFNLFNK
jgi:hypothetical protein